MILVVNQAGQRLCQDDRWRSFANFGTMPWCVKEYSKVGWAKRKARFLRGACVVKLPPGASIDASGEVRVDDERKSLLEFKL